MYPLKTKKMADPDVGVDGTRNPVAETSDVLKSEHRNKEVCIFFLSPIIVIIIIIIYFDYPG